MTDLPDVVQFIQLADDATLNRIIEQIKARRKALAAVTAASVTLGAAVEISGLSPKYLNGLKGTVSDISGQRCQVLLDEESTKTLRWSGTRFNVRQDCERYPLPGIPLQCAKVMGEPLQQASNG